MTAIQYSVRGRGSRLRWLYIALLAVAVTLVGLHHLGVFQSAPKHGFSKSSKTTPYQDSGVAEMQKRRIEAAKQRQFPVNPPNPSENADRYHLFKPEMAEKLRVLGGILVSPVIYHDTGRTNFSMEEVLVMFPYLKKADGTIHTNEAQKLQSLLAEHLAVTKVRTEMMLTNRTALEDSKLKEATDNRMGVLSPREQIRNLITSMETRPERIEPLDPLTAISPSFSKLSYRQMRDLLFRLAQAQSYVDRGLDTTLWQQNLQTWASNTKKGIELSEEQAAMLIATPLEKLVAPVYGPGIVVNGMISPTR
jgi:hypothetical protein